MDNLQAYLFLFNDSFITSLICVPRTSYASDAMLAFGIYNRYLILIVSLLAKVIGGIINWVIGSYIRKLEKLEQLSDRVESFSRGEDFFNRKGKWILLLTGIPFWGALFTTIAGVLRLRFSHFIILIVFSQFIAIAIDIFFV